MTQLLDQLQMIQVALEGETDQLDEVREVPEMELLRELHGYLPEIINAVRERDLLRELNKQMNEATSNAISLDLDDSLLAD